MVKVKAFRKKPLFFFHYLVPRMENTAGRPAGFYPQISQKNVDDNGLNRHKSVESAAENRREAQQTRPRALGRRPSSPVRGLRATRRGLGAHGRGLRARWRAACAQERGLRAHWRGRRASVRKEQKCREKAKTNRETREIRETAPFHHSSFCLLHSPQSASGAA